MTNHFFSQAWVQALVFSLNISFLLVINPTDIDPVCSAEKETIFFFLFDSEPSLLKWSCSAGGLEAYVIPVIISVLQRIWRVGSPGRVNHNTSPWLACLGSASFSLWNLGDPLQVLLSGGEKLTPVSTLYFIIKGCSEYWSTQRSGPQLVKTGRPPTNF